MNTRVLGLMGAILLIAGGLLAGPALVSAHAGYESSIPAANEVVAESPSRVDVYFSQEVFKITGRFHVRVLDASGALIAGDGAVDDDDRTHIFTELSEPLAEGLYVVEWLTTSDTDGDSEEGSFCFSVVAPLPEPPPEACQEEPPGPTATAVVMTPTVVALEPTPTAVPTGGGDGDSGDGRTIAVVGGVIGAFALAVVVGGAVVWLRRSRT